MTGFYLLDNPQPITQQWGYPRRGASLSGTCIIHTAECALDNVGEDTSAEGTAAFIRNRSDYGSYHTLVDSDSIVEMVPYEYEAWQDSQTNPWAVGLSCACQADAWHLIPADRRDRIYRNLATAAADFVTYMKTKGITVPLKRITGAQARNRVPGFCAHGDSGVDRHDPGTAFDWALFFKYTAAALAGTITTQTKETTLTAAEVKQINAHATAEANRVIDYVGKLLVEGYTVGKKAIPGGNNVNIVTQHRVTALTDLVAKSLATPNLTAEQITDAIKAGLAEGVDLDATVTVKKVS